MKIYFLGTNGWYDSKTGNTVSLLVETKSSYIVLDAGSGISKIDQFIKHKKPIYLFLSHFHLDHIFGLHALGKFDFSQGIDIFGPPGLRRMFSLLINQPYSMPVSKLRTKIRLHELSGAKVKQIPGLEYSKLRHSSFCYGYRFSIEGKVFSYCTDTGPCKNILALARQADLLILECAYKLGQDNKSWPHLNPKTAAILARDAGSKRLILTHFDAQTYQAIPERNKAGLIARRYFKNTLIARDGLRLNL